MLAIWFQDPNCAVRNAGTGSYSLCDARWIETGIVDKSGDAALPVLWSNVNFGGQWARTQKYHSDEEVLNIQADKHDICEERSQDMEWLQHRDRRRYQAWASRTIESSAVRRIPRTTWNKRLRVVFILTGVVSDEPGMRCLEW
jgi:hypothetical protein